MDKIALTIGNTTVESPVKVGADSPIKDASLGGVISGFLTVGFYIVGFLLFIWMAWGVFQYIFAGGDKAKLAAARSRITWAIIGFVIVVIASFVSQYAQEIIKPQNVNITRITNN